MTMRTPAALLIVLLLLLGGCASSDVAQEGTAPTATESAPASPTEEPAPTDDASPSEDPSPSEEPAQVDGTIVGTLGGSSIEGGCVWLDADDGTRYELVAGPDSNVAIDPSNFVIATTDGEVIAEEGDRVRIEGMTDPGLVTFCQVGENFVVEDAEPVS